jgi:APA family basic amino acid/polyamine antiporter
MEQYGNLYGNLLDYVVFSVLIFYILTVAAVFVMRRKRPDAERPYRAFGYPLVPALYIVGAVTIVLVLLLYRTQTTWPGLLIVLTGIPVYFLWHRRTPASPLSPLPLAPLGDGRGERKSNAET